MFLRSLFRYYVLKCLDYGLEKMKAPFLAGKEKIENQKMKNENLVYSIVYTGLI